MIKVIPRVSRISSISLYNAGGHSESKPVRTSINKIIKAKEGSPYAGGSSKHEEVHHRAAQLPGTTRSHLLLAPQTEIVADNNKTTK